MLHQLAETGGQVRAGDGENGTDLDVALATAILRWWRDAGVDIPLDEAPQRRFDQGLSAGLALTAEGPAFERSEDGAGKPVRSRDAVETSPFGADSSAAKTLAAQASDLEALRQILEAFEGCGLKRTATRLVFADGNPEAKVMLVGEAPGADEDRIGKPFVGRAGQLLDRMLASISMDRSKVYIANVIPWRPPGNRTPTPQETQTCLPFIRRQIELSAAEVLVCLGASATQTLLNVRDGITRARGRWFEYACDDGRRLRALATLHPAYLLRQPAQKRNAWADMRALAGALGAHTNHSAG